VSNTSAVYTPGQSVQLAASQPRHAGLAALQLEFDAGKSPSIFNTLLGLRIPQLVDQVCYDAGLP